MRSNWSAANNCLIYHGTSFLGYVIPCYTNKLSYGVKFYNGDGAENPKSSPILYFEDFNEAVAVVERFFDLEYKLQNKLFETLTNPTTKDVKSSKELTSILKG